MKNVKIVSVSKYMYDTQIYDYLSLPKQFLNKIFIYSDDSIFSINDCLISMNSDKLISFPLCYIFVKSTF